LNSLRIWVLIVLLDSASASANNEVSFSTQFVFGIFTSPLEVTWLWIRFWLLTNIHLSFTQSHALTVLLNQVHIAEGLEAHFETILLEHDCSARVESSGEADVQFLVTLVLRSGDRSFKCIVRSIWCGGDSQWILNLI
jgi:hypothetical protein